MHALTLTGCLHYMRAAPAPEIEAVGDGTPAKAVQGALQVGQEGPMQSFASFELPHLHLAISLL